MNRNVKSKAVITNWDGIIDELVEAFDKDQIEALEKLRKGLYNEKKKRYEWDATKHIIITVKRNVLPEDLNIYGSLKRMPIRPFVEL